MIEITESIVENEGMIKISGIDIESDLEEIMLKVIRYIKRNADNGFYELSLGDEDSNFDLDEKEEWSNDE